MNNFLRYARVAALPLILLLPLTAESSKKDAKKGAGISSEQADQILDELKQIRQLLEQQAGRNGAAAPARVKLDLQGFQMLGSKDAPLTLVEFTDYQCPFCRQFHTTTYTEIKKSLIDTGKVRFFSRDLPLDALHPNAMRAAEAARCAVEQGQYWQLRDIMGANPDRLDMDSLMTAAASLKMNTGNFKTCVESEKYKEAVQTDVLEAMKIGAEATPTFVLGNSTAQGVDGLLLVGAQPYSEFVKAIQKLEAAR